MHKRFRVFTRVKGRTYALISYILPHAKRFHKRPFGGLPQISVRFKPENDTRTNGRGVFDDGANRVCGRVGGKTHHMRFETVSSDVHERASIQRNDESALIENFVCASRCACE